MQPRQHTFLSAKLVRKNCNMSPTISIAAVVPGPVIVKNSYAHGLSAGPIIFKNSSTRSLSSIGDLENQKRYIIVELLNESDAEEEARIIRLWICCSVATAVAGGLVVVVRILVLIGVTNRM